MNGKLFHSNEHRRYEKQADSVYDIFIEILIKLNGNIISIFVLNSSNIAIFTVPYRFCSSNYRRSSDRLLITVRDFVHLMSLSASKDNACRR